MSNASIKITQLGPISPGNLTASTVIPVVGLNVTATTQKVALGNIANFILLNAGTSLPAANISNLSYSVVNAAQPNITSVGNLTGLVINNIANFKIPGGGSGQFIATDGNGNLSWATGEGAGLPGGNANTVQYNSGLNTFAGSPSFTYDNSNSRVNTTNMSVSGNLVVTSAQVTSILNANFVNITGTSNTRNILANGNITANFFIGDGSQLLNVNVVTSNYANFAGNITISSQPNITSLGNLVGLQSNGQVFINNNTVSTSNSTGALRVAGGVGVNGNIHSGGEIHSFGNVVVGGNTLFVGPTADATGLTNPALIIFHAGDKYIQAALKNSLGNGSADWVAYGDNGTDSQGWADMGFCSSTFNDANYTITGPGDGYLFVETFAGSYGGNLVLATGNLGTVKDIIFATNGFLSNNEFGRISHSQQQLHIKATTSSGNITSGALRVDGGVGIASNLNVGGVISGNGSGITAIQFNSVVGLGNVASLNRDGNSSNVLFGNGVFASLASSGYNDSNVALFLSTFGSNTINTTGDVSFGNISANGNIIPNSNVTYSLGNTTNRFNDLYLANNSIFLGDATLSANGNSLVVNNIVVTDSNINSIGNIAELNLDNSSSNILYGNGVFAPVFPAENGTSNINIAIANGPVTVTANGSTWGFDPSGQLTFPGNQGYMYSPGGNDLRILNNQNAGFIQLGWQDGAVLTPSANFASNVTLNSNGVTLTTTDDSYTTTKDWIFDTTGLLTLPGGNTKIGNQYGSEAILASNTSFGVATQGANVTTFINWSDDVSNTSLVSALYVNAPGANAGDIHIRTGGIGNANIWQFNVDGNLVLPNGNSVIYSTANSSLDPINPNVSTMTLTPDPNYSSQVLVLDPTAPGHIHLRAFASSNIDEPSANIFLGGENTSFEVTQGANNVARIHSGGNTWTFTNAGDLQLASGNSVISSLPNNAGDGSGLSTLNLYPDSSTGDDRYLIIDPTGPAHLHLRAGGNIDASNVLLYLGGEQTYVQIDDGYQRVSINSYDSANATSYNWRFGNDGNLTIAGSIITPNNNVTIGNVSVISQGANSVAIGSDAGSNTQGANSVAIGAGSGTTNQGGFAIAIGQTAGSNAQGLGAIAIGAGAASNSQSELAVALGQSAGFDSQGNAAVAIGNAAGQYNQGPYSVAIGDVAGFQNLANKAVAIGANAGVSNTSVNSIYIGSGAGANGGSFANVIVLNSSGSNLNPEQGNSLYISTVRNDTSNISNVVMYNPSTKEVSYSNTFSIGGNISAGNIVANTSVSIGNLVIDAHNVASNFGFLEMKAFGNVGERAQLLLNPSNTGSSISMGLDGSYDWTFTNDTMTGRNVSLTGNFTGNTNGYPIGYMDIPQVSAGNTTLSLSDAGKHYYSNIAANATITIPTNSSVPFRTGSVVTFIIKSIGNLIITPTAGVNLFLAGNNISNVQRVVGPYGMATILKVEDDTWFINGTGVY